MRIRVGQLGGRMYYGIPQILHGRGMLQSLHTDFVVNKPPFSWMYSLAGDSIKSRLKNRIPEVPAGLVHQMPATSLLHLYRLHSSGLRGIALHQEYLRVGKALGRSMVKSGLRDTDAVFMIGSTSEYLFKEAKAAGLVTIMEQIIAPSLYTLDVMQSEWESYPQWEDPASEVEALKFWGDINSRDWLNADYIVCGSQFVVDAIASVGGPSERCVVIPYGVPPVSSPRGEDYTSRRPLRVLTVGTVGLRKGTHYILEAAKHLVGQCEFTILGGVPSRVRDNVTLSSNVSMPGHIPRVELPRYFQWADVFLLPSLSEGSATVCYEALMHGLPLVVTHNAGQFIENGVEGFVIPMKSSEAIVSTLGRFVAEPGLVAKMSKNASCLSNIASYDAYKERIINVVSSIK